MDSKAFQNAYNFALSYVLSLGEGLDTISSEDITLAAESALRDWDAFAGARHTDYVKSEYELSDTEWDNCWYAVCEVAEGRLWDKLEE